jgi:hypothetical protein
MPVWLRIFTFNKIQEYYNKQNEEIEKTKEKSIERLSPNISTPPKIKPDYLVKASK